MEDYTELSEDTSGGHFDQPNHPDGSTERAEVNAGIQSGRTSLMLAHRHSFTKVALSLQILEKGADDNRFDKYCSCSLTQIHTSENALTEAVVLLLEKRVNSNLVVYGADTPLVSALQSNCCAAMTPLECGTNAYSSYKPNNGHTQCNIPKEEPLLSVTGAAVDTLRCDNDTPFKYYVFQNNLMKAVKLLFEKGTDFSPGEYDAHNPLMCTLEVYTNQLTEARTSVQEQGSKINTVCMDEDNSSAFLQNQSTADVTLLFEKGGDNAPIISAFGCNLTA